MSSHSQALPAFKDVTAKFSFFENMINSGMSYDNYRSILDDVCSILRRWTTLSNAVAHNAQAANMVVFTRRRLNILSADKSFILSHDVLDVLALYTSIVKINPALGGVVAITSPKASPPTGPVRVILLLFDYY